jgi:beta-mannanase
MKATHGRIFLEWRWEMNRGAMQPIVHSPRDYIRAWDHVRAIFNRAKVNNVAWVWCPSSKGWGNVPGYVPGPEFYPGNNEVDWLCADVYPRLGSFVSFESAVRPFLSWASHINKPIMIGEFGAPRSYSPRQRAQWLNDMAKTVMADHQIKALVYFDGSPAGRAAVLQYGLDPGSAPMRAFRGIAHQRYFERTSSPGPPP